MPRNASHRSGRANSLWPLLLAASLGVAGVSFSLVAADNVLAALATVLVDGLTPLVNMLAATLGGLAIIRRLRPDAGRALVLASAAGLGVAILITCSLLLGLAGLLNGLSAWLIVGLLGVLGAWDIRGDLDRWKRPLPFSFAAWLWLLAAAGLGIALAASAMPPGLMWGDEPHGYDVVSYHLQIPREWHEAGRIMPLEHNVFSYFPLGQEMLYLLLMHQMGGPWAAMYACHLQSLLLVALAVLGIYGVVPGAAPLHRTAGAVMLATLPWSIMLGSVAYNEALLILASVLCCAWLLRSLEGGWAAPLLAGLFAGLGVAAKYPALPMLGAGGVALAIALLLPSRDRLQEPGGQSTEAKPGGARPNIPVVLLAFALGAAVIAGPWLLRNIAWIGNPVFPLATGLFGDGGWHPELIERWNLAHSLAEGEGRAGRVVGELLLNPRFGWLIFPAALAAAGAWTLRRDRQGSLLVAWLGMMLVVWIGFTHLQGRFFVVAAPAAVALVILVFSQRPLWPGWTVLLACAVAVSGLAYSGYSALRITSGRTALFGVGSLVFATPFEDSEQMEAARIYLVGDARAFVYPAGQLHYKVVFNVPPADGALRAWLGAALEEAPPESRVVIDPAEVQRLNQTYGTPLLEVEVGPDPVAWTMEQVRQAMEARPIW